VNPGDNLPAAINNAGVGGSLCVKRGEYRLTASLVPKAQQTLTFEPGAVLNGSKLVTNWIRTGGYWVAGGQTQEFSDASWLSSFKCPQDPSDCVFEDLFMDDVPLDHVSSLAELGAGRVFFDKAADKMYISEDPSGHDMEATVATIALESSADNVTVRGATIEKVGWIGLKAWGDGWTIEQNEIRHSHATGMRIIGDGHVVRRNYLHHNGNTGLVSTDGTILLFEENEIANNNYLGFGTKPTPWHEGGVKMLKVSQVNVRNNYSHHNDGDGWWFDTNNVDVLVENNFFTDNARYGFFYEVSWRAVIRHNVFRNNGTDREWSGGGLRVSTSKDVEVDANLFDLNRHSTLFVNMTDRGSGLYGTFRTENLFVHDNVFMMSEGWVGCSRGTDEISSPTANNLFEANRYLVSDLARKWWIWRPSGFMDWQQWQAQGFDITGTLSTL
jgi:hypothetical protein